MVAIRKAAAEGLLTNRDDECNEVSTSWLNRKDKGSEKKIISIEEPWMGFPP